jgi:DNA-binding IclR family transcriptional regulator
MSDQLKALSYLCAHARASKHGGARTFHIAHYLDMTTPKARRLMLGLERAGKVRRSERYSAVNDIFWVPVDLAQEVAHG